MKLNHSNLFTDVTLASEDKDTPVREKKKENSSTCLKDQTWKKFANIIKLDIASLKNIVKRHMKTVCENTPDCRKENCIKQHPKVCKHFRAHGKCRHYAECAYQHVEQVNFQKLNENVAQVIITKVKSLIWNKKSRNLKWKWKIWKSISKPCTIK